MVDMLENDRARSSSMPVLALERVRRLITKTWPELGDAKQRKDAGGAVYVFTGRTDVEMRLGAASSGGVRVVLQVFPAGEYMPVEPLAQALHYLAAEWEWSSAEVEGRTCLRLVRTFRREDLGATRQVVLSKQVEELRAWTHALCPCGGEDADEAALVAPYRKFEDVLAPVIPWQWGDGRLEALMEWAAGVADLLAGGVSTGVAAPTPLEQSLALSLLANVLYRGGQQTLGQVVKPALNTEQTLHLAQRAPGALAVPARVLRIGGNRYDLSNEAFTLLSGLAAAGCPAVFSGTFSELQGVFHGGQGAANDPLDPAVCPFPEADMDILVAFAADEACRKTSMNTPQFRAEVRATTAEWLADTGPGQARRLARQTAARVVNAKLHPNTGVPKLEFVQRATACKETFGGLSTTARARRHDWVQQHFLERLADPALGAFLKEHLLGQNTALAEAVSKLQRQVLAGVLHQPFHLGALGPTGTGKSQFADLLARWLGVPFVNIDAASMSDSHTAVAQVVGSGRGIVDSDQPGRLEQVAKHHLGAVVEVSDIDHANSSVRTALTDLFLQVLQTGYAQSAKGHTFDCSNLVLVFTLNLPDGKDENMFHRTGFGKAPTLEEVRKEARRELKKLFSAAFWGRVGEPVLFGPLSGGARTEILRRALAAAAATALERFSGKPAHVEVPPEAAARLMASGAAPSNSFGARGLLELGQDRAAQAVLDTVQGGALPSGALELTVDSRGNAALQETD